MTDAPDQTLDATGLLCPLPVLKAARRLRGMAPGAVLELRTDDPAAVVDVPHYCAESGAALLSSEEDGAVTTWRLRKP
ncbi:MAG: sulfurtransferase TusA family protein [Hasllibacter sp.]